MVKINWTTQAKTDLINIAEFIARDSKKFAKIQISRIRQRTQQIADFPHSGRTVPELNDKDIREVIIGNYRIIYRIVNENRVDILTVHHSARILRL